MDVALNLIYFGSSRMVGWCSTVFFISQKWHLFAKKTHFTLKIEKYVSLTFLSKIFTKEHKFAIRKTLYHDILFNLFHIIAIT
jgi:hypothetical protein